MQLHRLYRGRSKSNLKLIMIDSIHKVNNYKDALVKSDPGSGKTWHYKVEDALPDEKVWRKHNNYGQWTNYNASNPPLVRNGSRV